MPSIGTFSPGRTITAVPIWTVSTGTVLPVFRTACSGFSASTALMAARAFSVERSSSHFERANRNTTAAPSMYSSMQIAPITARLISILMSRYFSRKAFQAFFRIGGQPRAMPAIAAHFICSHQAHAGSSGVAPSSTSLACPAIEIRDNAKHSPLARTFHSGNATFFASFAEWMRAPSDDRASTRSPALVCDASWSTVVVRFGTLTLTLTTPGSGWSIFSINGISLGQQMPSTNSVVRISRDGENPDFMT